LILLQKKEDNDLKIEDTNEGELYDGDERRVELKKKEAEKLNFELNRNKQSKTNESSSKKTYNPTQASNTTRSQINYGDNLNRPDNGLNNENREEDQFERRLAEKARKMKELLLAEEKTGSLKHSYFNPSSTPTTSDGRQQVKTSARDESGLRVDSAASSVSTYTAPTPRSSVAATTTVSATDYTSMRPIDADTAKVSIYLKKAN
jgi:hypothetical protein